MSCLSLVMLLFCPKPRTSVMALGNCKVEAPTGVRIVTDFGRSIPIFRQELALLRALIGDEINGIVFGDG